MGRITISLEEIAANAAAARLQSACNNLGDSVWQHDNHPAWERLLRGGLGPSSGYGSFDRKFFGVIFTPNKVKCDDASMTICLGVLKDAVPEYEVSLTIRDIPEFHASIGLWGAKEAMVTHHQGSELERLRITLGEHWHETIEDYVDKGTDMRCLLLAHTRPFTEVFGRVDDWAQEAREFFDKCMGDLFRVKESDLQALQRLVVLPEQIAAMFSSDQGPFG
jgi:hypothetical protein